MNKQPGKLDSSGQEQLTTVPGPGLAAFLLTPVLTDKLVSVYHITLRQRRESAFAIYKGSKGYEVSDLSKDPRKLDGAVWMDFIELHETALTGPLITKPGADGTFLFRDDVALKLHSHPMGPDAARPRDWLKPSVQDLGIWEGLNLVNPCYTEAILVAEAGRVVILLFRQPDPSIAPVPYYAQLDGDEGVREVIRVMNDSGLDTVVVEFDPHNRAFPKDQAARLQQFLG